ncbi:hypothetical protein PINS_up014777 [Pythium insidiosum]|nr:hypothetical protein PINS_up014777 [Pythium insidiosum]
MSTALDVFTQPLLFSKIVSFQSGVPGWLVQNLRLLMPPGCTRYQSYFVQWINNATDKDDRAAIERFADVLELNSRYWNDVITLLNSVATYAIKHDCLDLATKALNSLKGAGRFDAYWLLCAAVESGRLEAVKWFCRHVPAAHEYRHRHIRREALYSAIQKNALDVVKWVVARWMHDARDRTPVRLAARLTSPDMFRFLLENGYPLCGLLDALQAKSMGCVQEFIDRGAVFDRESDETMEFFASVDVSMLRFLHERDMMPRTIPSAVVESFIEDNRVAEMKFLLESKVLWPSAQLLYHSAEYSTNTAMLRLLLRCSPRGCLLKARNIARRVGHTQIEEELDRWIDPDVIECESRRHGSRAKRRRCQKENVVW